MENVVDFSLREKKKHVVKLISTASWMDFFQKLPRSLHFNASRQKKKKSKKKINTTHYSVKCFCITEVKNKLQR